MSVTFARSTDLKLCTEYWLRKNIAGLFRYFGLSGCDCCGAGVDTICSTCRRAIRYIPPTELPHHTVTPLTDTRWHKYSFFEYTKPLKSLFGQYKFHAAFQLQYGIYHLLNEYFSVDPFLYIKNTFITKNSRILLFPVPMTSAKEKIRRFSPAYEISIMIGRLLSRYVTVTPVICKDFLHKTQETVAQSKKDRLTRLLSLQRAFNVSEAADHIIEQISPTDIILVDDIFTTGATTTVVTETIDKYLQLHHKNIRKHVWTFAASLRHF